MTGLPPDVHDRYRQLTLHRNWPPETLAAVLSKAEWYRDLDEGTTEHSYFEWTDEEDLAELGTRWLWDTVMR